jgi:PAS domain S-box-containing protein
MRSMSRSDLLRERDRYLAVFENSIDCVGIADVDGKLMYANRAARQLVGLGADEDISNRTVADCWPREYLSKIVINAYREIRRTGSFRGELIWRGRDGGEMPLLVTAMGHKNESGQLEYYSMIAHDLRGFESSHLQATREQLKVEKLRAQRYLDVAGVALVALDLEGRITMVNRRGCILLEDTEENILGKNYFDWFLEGEDHEQWSTYYARLVDGTETHIDDGELWIRTHRNNRRLIAWHSSPVHDESGNFVGIIASGEDITEARQSEEALQASEAQLRIITDSLPVLISQIDRELRYTFNNAAYEGFFGVSREALKGTYLRDLIGEQAFANCQPHIHDALAGKASTFEMKFTGAGGRRRDATVHLVPDVHNGGDVEGFYAVISDITDQKRLERALRQSQKMEAVALLASGISHDFNNLLMGIHGCSNIALERLDPDSPVRIYLDEIRSAAASGASISRQLVDLSRQSETESANTALDALVANSESILHRLLGADVELRLDLQAGPGRAQLGIGQLKQILLNLVANARDSLGDGGTIAIETRAVELGTEDARKIGVKAGNYLKLVVRDDGAGMDAKTVDRIFEPFFTTKDVSRGSGLGLFTVYNIVTQHAGHIEVASAPGEGTSFTLYLPQNEAEVALGESDELRGRGGSETILVVEDDRLVQLALRDYLARSGYQVIEASDGDEAVRVAREHQGPIPLLISDMVLPGMSGSRVAKAVVEIHPEAKVIYMSAHSPEMLVEAGHLELGTETLQKPFGESELLDRIREVLGHAPAPSP